MGQVLAARHRMGAGALAWIWHFYLSVSTDSIANSAPGLRFR
ncbi:hypothetical protein FMEAI12_4640046 [Parafrankia sp. Ea1.12]|nr:hypothetical protein FMEAI12_4640046 [Parafrankia sp. Ea1.12]